MIDIIHGQLKANAVAEWKYWWQIALSLEILFGNTLSGPKKAANHIFLVCDSPSSQRNIHFYVFVMRKGGHAGLSENHICALAWGDWAPQCPAGVPTGGLQLLQREVHPFDFYHAEIRPHTHRLPSILLCGAQEFWMSYIQTPRCCKLSPHFVSTAGSAIVFQWIKWIRASNSISISFSFGCMKAL